MTLRRRRLPERREHIYRHEVKHGCRKAKKQRTLDRAEIKWCLRAWEGPARISCVAELDRYNASLGARPSPNCFFPYASLKKAIRKLPTRL